MFQVVRVSVRRALRGTVRFSEAAAGRAVTRPESLRTGSESGRTRTQGGGRTGTERLRPGALSRTCTVDPRLEEQFVFVDCTDPEEDSGQELDLLLTTSSSSSSSSPPQKHLRTLELQLQVLKGMTEEEEPDSLIEFQDVDFPLDQSIVTATKKKKKKKKKAGSGEHKVVGTPDVDEPVSTTCCSGCGAILHCTAAAVPGYLPSEKFKALQKEDQLASATCQRCYLLTHHQKALRLEMSKDQYRAVVRQIRSQKALVLLIVDLFDVPDSIVADLPELVGNNKHIVVLGNKIDLLPGDSPNYLQRIKRQLRQYCEDAGFGGQVTDIHLISAKTGYGVEGVITSLQQSWKYKGDVYLVGSANAGKSTLFNTLLESDYCKSKASDIINKATISPWPGTTLNLLKFPIINPTPYRMFRRQERLNETSQQMENELSPEEVKRLQHFSRQGYLVGRVGRTFRNSVASRQFEFDPDSLAFGENDDGHVTTTVSSKMLAFTHNELKDAHWLMDTPGIMKDQDILHLLTEQEVKSVVPSRAVIPRTFVLKPGTSLFVGALARIDLLQGVKSCWFSVVVSGQVPVHITSLDKADAVYQKHAGLPLLGVPLGGSERMRDFPPLVPQDVRLEGRGYLEAAADIKLSSAGWVSVTAAEGEQLQLRLLGPEAAGFSVRTPPLLPYIVSLKGQRIRKSVTYKPQKPPGLVDGGLSVGGAKRLQIKKEKKKTL
ncbi:nitric oxide-associated protein 1 isoform X3 [Sphaeramia orbicularis]|uniref:nitric oxide-associated protein 1 isoform X3 n=1 Tax=Sphaeramia orbicularis TaxID=375764 RepID=UPI00117F650E|nr:nitric oxide-associated protein 1 isoform X3 [Sphaeramia orbicularis]